MVTCQENVNAFLKFVLLFHLLAHNLNWSQMQIVVCSLRRIDSTLRSIVWPMEPTKFYSRSILSKTSLWPSSELQPALQPEFEKTADVHDILGLGAWIRVSTVNAFSLEEKVRLLAVTYQILDPRWGLYCTCCCRSLRRHENRNCMTPYHRCTRFEGRNNPWSGVSRPKSSQAGRRFDISSEVFSGIYVAAPIIDGVGIRDHEVSHSE